MSAHIVELSRVAAHRQSESLAGEQRPEAQPLVARFQFWRGATGERYLHTVYGLLDCPTLPAANYILVRRVQTGERTALRVGRTAHAAPTLNLAEIRHRAAQLGANEVHVHFIPDTEQERRIVELDLHARLFAGPGAGADHSTSLPA